MIFLPTFKVRDLSEWQQHGHVFAILIGPGGQKLVKMLILIKIRPDEIVPRFANKKPDNGSDNQWFGQSMGRTIISNEQIIIIKIMN